MKLRSTFVALLTLLCAQATVRANTTYNLVFGNYVNESLQYAGNLDVSGDWTEIPGGSSGGTEQIACMVSNSGIVAGTASANNGTPTCGNPGPGAANNISIYTPPSNYALWGGASSGANSTYFEDDGDPDYGAPIYFNASADLIAGDSYTLSFYEASNEEADNNGSYNDYWQVYLLSTDTYICPTSVCTAGTYADGTANFQTPTAMVNTGEKSTPWQLETYTFTATAKTVIEFVTDAVVASGTEPTPGNFNPPIFDLADIVLTQNSTAPEPSTWALTILGVGAACIASRLRRRSSPAAPMKRIQQG
jgi:hypothetical protein